MKYICNNLLAETFGKIGGKKTLIEVLIEQAPDCPLEDQNSNQTSWCTYLYFINKL